MYRSRRKAARVALLALAALLTCAGVAFAAVGLTNASFEDGVDATGNPIGWDAKTLREIIYETDTEVTEPDCANDPRRSVCIVESDTFTVEGNSYTVSPIDGTKMARLGGPFESNDQEQPLDRYVLTQQFQVDPANPVIKLNYNIFTFDYSGFDELRFNVRLVDEAGDEIGSFVQGAFADGTELKTTGWQSGFLDLSGYENQTVTLIIDSGGTSDNLYGFWAYVDAGEVPESPVDPPTIDLPELPEGWEESDVLFQSDDNTGQTWITIPNSLVGSFAEGCMPLDISVPIDPGAATVSNVSLIVDGDPIPMTDADADGSWTAHITCVSSGTLLVQYTLTEIVDGVEQSQTFLIPVGGITLIDPAGIVFDKAEFDALNTTPADTSDDEAFMEQAAIQGAKVRLQRGPAGAPAPEDGGTEPSMWTNVLSGDPGISPKVNPQTTGVNGRYAWDVEEGWWRVVVTADGFQTTASKGIYVPPEVTDLHIPMVSGTAVQDDDGDGVPNDADQCDNQTGPASNNGCPVPPADGDGDGVPDASDACPAQPGGGTLNGCPVSPPPPPPADGDKDGVADTADQCPAVAGTLPNGCNPVSGEIPGPPAGPCANLTGTKLAACNRAEALKKKIAKCNKIKNKGKRSVCVKKARALSKCETKKGKKKKACVKKAKKIGAAKKKK